MSEEIQTPEQIKAATEAKAEGIIDALLARWKPLAAIAGTILSLLGVTHADSHNAAKAAQAEAESGTNWIGVHLDELVKITQAQSARIEALEKQIK